MSHVRGGGWIARFSFHSAYILISSCRARFDPAISPWDFAQSFGTFYRTFSGSVIGLDAFFRSLKRNTVSSFEVGLFNFGFIWLSSHRDRFWSIYSRLRFFKIPLRILGSFMEFSGMIVYDEFFKSLECRGHAVRFSFDIALW